MRDLSPHQSVVAKIREMHKEVNVRNPSGSSRAKTHWTKWDAKHRGDALMKMDRGACKYSQLHMNYHQLLAHPSTHGTRAQETHDVTVPSTPTTTPRKGWRFATESPWTLWHTGGSRQGHPQDDQRHTTTRHRQASRQMCFQPQVQIRTEPLRETGDLRIVEHVVNRIEVETFRRILQDIAQRNGTNHPGEDKPGDRVHQDSSRISALTKLLM